MGVLMCAARIYRKRLRNSNLQMNTTKWPRSMKDQRLLEFFAWRLFSGRILRAPCKKNDGYWGFLLLRRALSACAISRDRLPPLAAISRCLPLATAIRPDT